MWTPKTKILYLLYQGTAAWLQISQRSKLAKRIRGGWAKRIISHCGENINMSHCKINLEEKLLEYRKKPEELNCLKRNCLRKAYEISSNVISEELIPKMMDYYLWLEE